tara:strand:- start:7463 stop:9520 length:2058 start_codon:yes stop_codon:yes gene_type:complete
MLKSKILDLLLNKEKKKEMSELMKYRTCFSSRTWFGHKLDKVKSGIQKYLRRREEKKMLWCIAEIYLFEVFAEKKNEKRATKGIITNMINRLIIMLDEEMLFDETEKYLVIRKYFENFEKSDRKNFMDIVIAAKILVNARELRRNSDIRSFWDYNVRDLEEAEESDEVYFKKFKECFERKDHECFKWMFKIFNRGAVGDKTRFRRKENIYMIWEYLFNLKKIKESPILKKCLEYKLEDFYKKNRKERFIFLSASIDIALHSEAKDKGSWGSTDNFKIINNLKKEYDDRYSNHEMILREIFEDRIDLEFDDYVIDMHCSEGRKLGKNKKDFKTEGGLVINEDKEYFVKEWRDVYNSFDGTRKLLKGVKKGKKAKKEKKVKGLPFKKKAVSEKKAVVPEKKKKGKTDREKLRSEKYKRIKKMRGKPDFDDLEKNLEKIGGIDTSKIKLCSENTCGNKVMCFEYEGKIWKEGRKSMNYNRDYCVLDECKELFGLRKIGMKRVLADFRMEKMDKSKKSWKDNWVLKYIKEDDEPVVYCVMDKIVHCNWKVPMEIGVIKHSFPGVRRQLKEFVKIGVFRGIFRCSDFNCRNVLVGCDNGYSQQYFVSIDEGDIGKRLDILGGREKWLIEALNKDKSIINEIIEELFSVSKLEFVLNKIKEYKFSNDLRWEVVNNWNNLRKDLESEGVLFV